MKNLKVNRKNLNSSENKNVNKKTKEKTKVFASSSEIDHETQMIVAQTLGEVLGW